MDSLVATIRQYKPELLQAYTQQQQGQQEYLPSVIDPISMIPPASLDNQTQSKKGTQLSISLL